MQRASQMMDGEQVKGSLEGQLPTEEPELSSVTEQTLNNQSLKLREGVPEAWELVSQKLLEAQRPEIVKREKRPESKIVHGFRLYRRPEGGNILLQVGMIPVTKGCQVLVTAVKNFLSRQTGQEVEVGMVSGWTCPCVDNEDKYSEIKEIALLLNFDDYASPKVGHGWFLEELFNLVHKRMMGQNYEVKVPAGNNLTQWLLRDIVRLFAAFRYEVLRQFALRIPLKERSYLKLKFHDFDKFKSVLSDTEWRAITGQALEDRVKECKAKKASLVHFKQDEYAEFSRSNAQVALEIFGKSSIAQIYQRINERNTQRDALIKKKNKDLSVPLRKVLEALTNRGIYAGIHLLPVILKYRPGDLSVIERITTIRDGRLVPNDHRFTTVEDYLRYAVDHPMSAADASRVVANNLTPEDFPALE